jgi:ATP-binding cassette, subfamily B, bacterial
VSLLTVFDVAATLFEQAPAIERVQAAVPGLVLLGVMLAGQSGLGIAAGWAQARLTPWSAGRCTRTSTP